jgi:hypothetical protein
MATLFLRGPLAGCSYDALVDNGPRRRKSMGMVSAGTPQ